MHFPTLVVTHLVLLIYTQLVSSHPTSTMTLETTTNETSYFNGSFTAPGLPVFKRTITGHDQDGLGHFLVSDSGDHRIARKAAGFPYEAAQAVMYGTFEMPVSINGVHDLDAIREGYKVSGTEGGVKTGGKPKDHGPLLTSFRRLATT